MRLSDSVYFLYIGTYFKDMFDFFFLQNVPEVWTVFVRTICLTLFGIFGPKWSYASQHGVYTYYISLL